MAATSPAARTRKPPTSCQSRGSAAERDALTTSCLSRYTEKAIDQSNELGDLDTADLFTEISRGIDKWLWFVEAHLQAER